MVPRAVGLPACPLRALGPTQDHPSLSSLWTTAEIAGAGAASLMSALADKAIVKKELLSVVAGTDEYHVNNKHDDKYSPLPPSKIVQRAEELVGQEVLYKLTSDNCEHFVNELRYGVSRSDQVRPQPELRPQEPDQTAPLSCQGLGISVGWPGWGRRHRGDKVAETGSLPLRE